MERFGPVEKVFRPSWGFIFLCLYIFGFFAVMGAGFLLGGVQASDWFFGSCGLVMFLPSLFLIVALIVRSRHHHVTLHRDGIVVKESNSPWWSKQYGDRPAVIAPGINGLLWADMQDAVAWQYQGDELPHRLMLSGPTGAVCLDLGFFYSQSTLLRKTLLSIIEERHVPFRIVWEERSGGG
jgi:hypothetical protein